MMLTRGFQQLWTEMHMDVTGVHMSTCVVHAPRVYIHTYSAKKAWEQQITPAVMSKLSAQICFLHAILH